MMIDAVKDQVEGCFEYSEPQVSPEAFMLSFFKPDEKVCFRVFSDKRDPSFPGAKLECLVDKFTDIAPVLREHNLMDRGVFFVVNSGGHEDRSITRINAQFVECDALPIEAQMAMIGEFPLPPNIIVKTRKSLHSYWLMKDAKLEDFRRLQKKLITRFDGDRACVNESRVMRLPGFKHRKGEPVMVECIRFEPGLRYTQEELEAELPEIEEDRPQVQFEQYSPAASFTTGTRKGLDLVCRKCEFIRHCRDNAATLSEHDWYAMITNLAVFEGGDEAIHEFSSAYPSYSMWETKRKIEHFMASNTKPITCKTIAEKRFQCPKLMDGGCGCKSPAALCYQPLTVDDMRSLLSEVKVRNTGVEDMQAAKSFISGYLFNMDPALAAAFISNDIKEHFGFKAAEAKALAKLQRDLFKACREKHETDQETLREELPEWYEPTEKGGLRFIPGLLAKHMSEKVDAFYGAESFYLYKDGVYVETPDIKAASKVRGFLQDRYATMPGINDTLGQWQMLIHKPVAEINDNPYIINVRNGLYNALNGFLYPHTPHLFSTVQINANHDPEAKCPEFKRFLSDVLRPPEIHLVQEIFGYLLIPLNKAQKSFVFVGAANGGKSTLLSVAQEILLGSANVSNISWQSLNERFKTAELFGKLANIFADLPSKSMDDNGLFKSLTGEDHITVERKNKNPFSFKPYARLLFSCNEIPRNNGDHSDGFYRRLIIIRFDNSVPAEKRDANLREKLAVERDGILMWAIEGLKRLIANKYVFTETESTRVELQRYKVDSNSVLSFLEECCEITEDAECYRDVVFMKYKEYCEDAGLKPVSQISFNKEFVGANDLIEKGLDRYNRRKIWKGLKLLE